MQLIVISNPETVQEEPRIINNLFHAGLLHFHLRKPHDSKDQIASLLNNIDSAFYNRIALHQHHSIAPNYGIKRLHYTELMRLQTKQEDYKMLKNDGYTISTSVHNSQLIPAMSAFEYVFFGPVFNSLSKQGYNSTTPPDFRVDRKGTKPLVIAIGGVQPHLLNRLYNMGFDGAAALGAIWQTPENAIDTFMQLKSALKK